MKKLFFLVAALALAAPARAADARDKTIGAALKSAIAGAMRMKESGYPSPYYVGITATQSEDQEDDCQMGALGAHVLQKQSFVVDAVRVGSYALDNYPLSAPGNFLGVPVSLDDGFALRYGLWRALDGDYKSAAAGFLRKEALRAVRGKAEYDTDDFSRERPRVRLMPEPAPPWSDGLLESACRQASAAFRKAPDLLSAQSRLVESDFWSRLRDSEGSKVDFGGRYAELDISASARAPDGLEVRAGRSLVAVSSADFPSPAEIRSKAQGVLSDISLLKVARTTSPFDAPAILDSSVAGALVLALGERLSGEELRNPYGAQIFRGKLGTRVLPRGLTLVDDPTLASFKGVLLAGHYAYDDQGMPAQKVTLVRDGVLKNFLLSRHPVIGFAHSNGHGRGAPGYWITGFPGTLILKDRRPLDRAKMIALLRRECRRLNKPYGILAERLLSLSQNESASGEGSVRVVCEMVYLVDARTGTLTLVRDLDLVGTPLSLMNNIVGVGQDARVENSVADGVPVSVVAPDLLLSDIETQRSNESPQKGPILPPPDAPKDAFSPPIVPTIPQMVHVEALRYVLKKAPAAARVAALPGVARVSVRSGPAGYVIDVEISGADVLELGKNARRLDAAMADEGELGRSLVRPPLPRPAYEVRYDGAWPPPL
ncbi:MAG TPA: metallopeptidase TldD-related protein [Elusimicrobiota bacterium]|nr:metallopeptidase TldD-related protein [Elusimicrobiota bacterium]